jgi:hypothetical protein
MMAKPGRYRDASNTLRSGEVGKYFKYYNEWSGQWVYHLLDEGVLKDLTICVPICGDDIEDIYLYFEDVPFTTRRRGAPRGARYDDTRILKLMAQINETSGENRPRRLAILAVSQTKLKLPGNSLESTIKRLADRWKNFRAAT